MRIEIDVDHEMVRKVEQMLKEMPSKKAPVALARAMNDAVSNINTNMKRHIRETYAIKYRDITKYGKLNVSKAHQKKLRASVSTTGKHIALDKFKFTPKTVNSKRKKQIKIGARKDSLNEIVGAFAVRFKKDKNTDKSSGPMLAIRTGRFHHPKKGKYAGHINSRTGKPIIREIVRRMYGPSVPQMFYNVDKQQDIEKQGAETFERRLRHHIDYVLNSNK